MVLYKSTKDGRVPMTLEEEIEFNASRQPAEQPKKTLDERLTVLELQVANLIKKSGR